MGGFASAIGDAAEKLAGKGMQLVDRSETARNIFDWAGSMKADSLRSPEGNVIINKLIPTFERIRLAMQGQADKTFDPIFKALQEPAYAKDIQMKKGPLLGIHSALKATNHPAAQMTDALMTADPNNSGKTLSELHQATISKSYLGARVAVFGKKSEILFPLIANLLSSPDPTMHSHAHALMDTLSVITRDNTTVANAEASAIKKDIAQTGKIHAKIAGITYKGSPFDIETSPSYHPSEAYERMLQNYGRVVLAPFIAVSHASTPFNLLASTPLRVVAKSLAGMNNQKVQNLVAASGILTSTVHSIIQDDFNFRTGNLAKLTKSPSAAALILKSFHNPAFNTFRMWQLSLFGAAGYHSAQLWAAELVKPGGANVRRAIAELTEMQLEPQNVIAQKGILSEEQLTKAIFHYTDNHAFIARNIDRSLVSVGSPFGRVAGLFHGYVTQTAGMVQRELLKMAKAGDIKGIAQFAGTVGILFPMAATLIKSAEVLLRTGSPTQAGKSVQDDWDGLLLKRGIGDAALTYIDLLSHFGAMGAMHSYIKAGASQKLGQALLGPTVGGILVQGIDDIILASKENKGGGHNYKPLLRDALADSAPIVGKIASHVLVPTKKEEGSGTFLTKNRGRRRKF